MTLISSELQSPEKIGECVKRHMSVLSFNHRLSGSTASSNTLPTVGSRIWEFCISCGRKFKILFNWVGQASPCFWELVTLENARRACLLVAVAVTVRGVYRWTLSRRSRIGSRIRKVIDLSEEAMLQRTIVKVQYATEYSGLTFTKIGKLFDEGCILIRHDSRVENQQSLELTAREWYETTSLDIPNQDVITERDTVGHLRSGTGIVFRGTWHAIWSKPPPVSAGLWDLQGKAQKISYDVIYLGRTCNRRKIEYSCAVDHGLSSGWIKFFYEENDSVFNFVRLWKRIDCFLNRLGYDHILMKPPGCWLPIWVPDPKTHMSLYLENHRIKTIADKIAITMRSDGSWNENVFLTTYRNTVSGNSQVSMGHQLSDVAMSNYLPRVRKEVMNRRVVSSDRE